MPQFVRIATLALLLLVAPSAHADTPWTVGVSAANQRRANQLFADGNDLFAREAHDKAIAKYRQALAIWNHPMLQFNMAVALIKLERYLDAADAIDAALSYGDDPFTRELYRRAIGYRDLVATKLGVIEAKCKTDGLQVSVDGQSWFTCAGDERRRVTPGEHVIVGELDGDVVLSVRVTVKAGSTQRRELAPPPPRVALTPGPGKLVYGTPRWLPWLIASVGAATVATGLVYRTSASRDMQSLTQEFERVCPPSCDDVWADQRAAIEHKTNIGTALVIGGGAVALTGLVWAAINRPRHVATAVELAPVKGGGIARVGFSF